MDTCRMSGYVRCYPASGGTIELFPSATGVTVIDGFDRPEDAAASWSSTITRKVMLGQVTGFCLHTDTPGDLATTNETRTIPGVMQRLMPITTVQRSYQGARIGDYYDAIVPLNDSTVTGAVYLWIDIECDGTSQVKIGNVTINLTYHGSIPTYPALPLQMGYSNQAMILGYNGEWGPYESLGVYCSQLLVDHRMQPCGGQIYHWDGTDTEDWATNNLPYSPRDMVVATFPFLPAIGDFDRTAYLSLLGSAASTMASHSCATGAWTYNIDEPDAQQLSDYAAEFTAQHASYPNIRSMVTKDLSLADGYDIDILCAVAEYIGNGRPEPADYVTAGKTLWMYVSCMSHGCNLGRDSGVNGWDDIANEYIDAQSGAPDLVIDRTAVEPFGFYLLGYKHGAESLLYYSAVESWPLWARTKGNGPIDPWIDQYNFGGNGDGSLIYPGGDQPGCPMGQTFRPYPSIRMKLLREASYLADALKADANQTWAQGQVGDIITDSLTWDRTMSNIVTLRNAVLDRK
jgi:hypothetical protein